MATIQAVCPNGHALTLRDNVAGPCPHCGQMIQIPDGKYRDGKWIGPVDDDDDDGGLPR